MRPFWTPCNRQTALLGRRLAACIKATSTCKQAHSSRIKSIILTFWTETANEWIYVFLAQGFVRQRWLAWSRIMRGRNAQELLLDIEELDHTDRYLVSNAKWLLNTSLILYDFHLWEQILHHSSLEVLSTNSYYLANLVAHKASRDKLRVKRT